MSIDNENSSSEFYYLGKQSDAEQLKHGAILYKARTHPLEALCWLPACAVVESQNNGRIT